MAATAAICLMAVPAMICWKPAQEMMISGAETVMTTCRGMLGMTS
jgi:hypothetical protein